MIGQRLSTFVTLVALLALSAGRTEAAKLRTRELLTTKELEEDAVFWGRELGGSGKGKGGGKGGSKGSKGDDDDDSGSGGKGKGGGKGGSKGSRARELLTTKELEEDAVFWNRELGGSGKGKGGGKGGSKGSKGDDDDDDSGSGGKGKGGGKGGSKGSRARK